MKTGRAAAARSAPAGAGLRWTEEPPHGRNAQLAAIHAVAEVVGSSLDLREVLDRALDKVLEVARVEAGSIYLLDRGDDRLVLAADRGTSPAFAERTRTFPLPGALSAQVMQSRTPWVVERSRIPEPLAQQGVRFLVSIPIYSGDAAQGLLHIGSRSSRRLHAGDLPFYAAVADQIGVAIENARLYETSRRELAERTRIEEALHASGKLYQTTLNALDEWVHMVDRDLRILFMNQPFIDRCRTLGLAPAVVGKRILELFPFLSAQVQDEYRQVFASGQPCTTIECTRIDGRPFHTETRKIPIVEHGQVERVITVIRDVTAKRQVEEALRESEERFSKAFHMNHVAMAITRRVDGRFIDVNPSWERLFGYTRGELAGRTSVEVGLFTDPAARQALLRRGRDEKAFPEVELQMRAKSGEVRELLVSAQALDIGGEACFISTFQDISGRKRAEGALRDSELKYRTLFEAESDALFLIDNGEGRLLEMNSAAVALYGYSRDELLRMRNTDLSAQPDETRRATQSGSTLVPLRFHRKKDGTVFPVEITARHVTWHGSPVHLAAIRDITARQRAEAALRESEERFRALFEFAPDAYFLVDMKGTFVDGNRAAERFSGYARSELIGKSVFEANLLPPEGLARAAEVLARSLPGSSSGPYDFTILRKDGQRLPLEILVFPIEIGVQHVLLGIARDITERKRAEAAMRDLSHRLLQAQEEERRRIARDLHDSTAQKLAGLIMALGRLDDAAAGAIETAQKPIAECLATAEDCVREIRNLSHLLHPPLLDELGLDAALDAFIKGFSERSGIAVTLDAPADLGRLPGDVELALFRIVQEGLGNILKHAGSAEAAVQLARVRDRVLLEVRDRGRGMPADLLERIRKRQPQSGMGIAGMRERLEPLSGELEIDSSTEGTTVRAIVPVPPGTP